MLEVSVPNSAEEDVQESAEACRHELHGEKDFFDNRDFRGEERWHLALENLAKEWRDSCMENAHAHNKAGYWARRRHIILGIPAPVTSLVTAAVTGMWDDPNLKYFVIPATCLASIMAVFHTYLNLGGRAERHWAYAAWYESVAAKIDLQVHRDIDFRTPADVFLTETRMEMGSLGMHAPQLPGKYYRELRGEGSENS